MKPLIYTLLFAAYYLLFAGPTLAQNTHLSDYQYQIDQYRRNYAEYQNFKNDYLAHPTLNNEQKAILSAKQTIVSRELAWANFVLILSDTISDTGVNYPLTDKAIVDLAAIAKYHFDQAGLVAKVVTRADLTTFTKNGLKATAGHKLALTQAQVASKLAQLIRFQTDAQVASDSILPKLEEVRDEVTVMNGLDQIQTLNTQISDQITLLSQKTGGLNVEQFSSSQFLSDSSEILVQIRANINRLISVIIDLDTNYVRH